jgi:peptidoglycan/xylan/chitin deacetylase (PgdA/CDA1 family)
LVSVARGIREAVFAGLDAIGGLRAFGASAWRHRRLLILCYHGVSLQDEHQWDPLLFVSPAFLRRRFELIRESGCTVLPLGEGIERMQAGTLPPLSVAITFDDGFHNFAAKAAPLLEDFGFPATNYVSTYYCLNQRPIPALALRYLLWRARAGTVPPGTFPAQDEPVALGDPAARNRLITMLLSPAVVAAGREAQHALIGDVAGRLGVDWDDILRRRLFHLMTPTEISDVSRRGVDIQLHTHRHRTPRDRDLFLAEIHENRERLEAMTGRPANHFCYPSGVVELAFLPWLREAGVASATTGFTALASAADDSLLLPRYIDTMVQTPSRFRGWLCGAAAIGSRRHSVQKD